MATTNYGWNLPSVGGDQDTWGDELNAAIGEIDAQMAKGMGQLLSSGAISSPTTTLDIAIPDSLVPGTATLWREFELRVTEIEPVSDGVSLQALVAVDGVPTYQSSDYRYSGFGTVDVTATPFGSASASAIAMHGGAFNLAAGLNPGLAMRIRAPSAAGHYTILTWTLDLIDTASDRDALFVGRGRYAGSGMRATFLRLKFSSGNISTARWALFGIPGL